MHSKCSTNLKYSTMVNNFFFLMTGRKWHQMPTEGFIRFDNHSRHSHSRFLSSCLLFLVRWRFLCLPSRFQSKGVCGTRGKVLVYHLQKVSPNPRAPWEDMDLEQRKTKNNTVQITSKSASALQNRRQEERA